MATNRSVVLTGFTGINNVSSSARSRKGDLQVARNVDVDDDKALRRRPGKTLAYSGVVHSLMTNGADLLFGEGTTLKRLDGATATTIDTGFSGGPITGLLLNDLLYYSDGTKTGVYENGVCREWGARLDELKVEVAAYEEACEGRGIAPTLLSYTSSTLAPLGHPPAGTILEHYNGRIYIVSGNVVWYTHTPWLYEAVDLTSGFMIFEHPVTMLKGVTSGVWVGTTKETIFAAGSDPQAQGGGFQPRRMLDCGVVPGTAQKAGDLGLARLNPGVDVVFLTEDGVFAGDSAGQIRNLTGDYFTPAEAPRGSSIISSAAGFDQYMFSLLTTAGHGTARVSVE